jgi:hypothetical protein
MGSRPRFDGIIISHLGNIDGRNEERENTLPYIQEALKAGWHVCIEVVFRNGNFLLPHIHGMTPVPPALLSKQRVWVRTHDAETLDGLCTINAHCFFGGESPLALTSSQFIMTMPPEMLSSRSIAAFPELAEPEWLLSAEPAGLCSNEPLRYI